MRKSAQSFLKNVSSHTCGQVYTDFLCQVRDICFDNVDQYANFSRRITALRILEYIYIESYLKTCDEGMLSVLSLRSFLFVGPRVF